MSPSARSAVAGGQREVQRAGLAAERVAEQQHGPPVQARLEVVEHGADVAGQVGVAVPGAAATAAGVLAPVPRRSATTTARPCSRSWAANGR